jgi:RNA polymerase sigma-70 factor (ECF subfamily)
MGAVALKQTHIEANGWLHGQSEVGAVGEPRAVDELVAGPGGTARPAQAFDAGDFNAVYNAWFGDVARWIRALGAPASDHDDLVQEVFVVVHRRLRDFDGRNLAGWLYRIAAHQVRDFRRLRWIKNVFKRSIPLSHRLASPGPTPVMALETRERRSMLEGLLSELSEPLRTTFVLFEIDGYTGEEIAAAHRVSINTVRARIHRARKKLLANIGASGINLREGVG